MDTVSVCQSVCDRGITNSRYNETNRLWKNRPGHIQTDRHMTDAQTLSVCQHRQAMSVSKWNLS